MLHRFFLLFCLVAGGAFAQLKQVQSVYILPMGSGLDQYLATRLVELRTFQIVTDPQRADAVLVDRIGTALEDKLAELYPDEKKKAEEEKEKKDGGGANVLRQSNLQRGKGTIFLVDRRSRTVLWSVYSPSKSTAAKDVNHNALEIAKKLTDAVKEVRP